MTKVTVRNIKGEMKPMNLFKYFDDGIRKRLPKMLAEDFKEELIDNIDQNVFKFHLSKRWLKFKQRIGADERPFVMFGHYKKAITIVTSDGHLSVGFKKTSMHPRAKISMGKLARELEYGDLAKNIPARPLWRFTANRYFRNRRARVGGIMHASLQNIKRYDKGN